MVVGVVGVVLPANQGAVPSLVAVLFVGTSFSTGRPPLPFRATRGGTGSQSGEGSLFLPANSTCVSTSSAWDSFNRSELDRE
jgi:hypothetical protein